MNFVDGNATTGVGASPVFHADGSVVFSGGKGLVFAHVPPTQLQTWTVSCAVTQAAASFGYIFAYTGPLGQIRHAALYSSTALRLYYYAGGARRSVAFPVRVDDGQRHRILLTVAAGRVHLRVDDGAVHTATLRAPIDPCNLAVDTCFFTVGHRVDALAGGRFHLTGVLHHITMLLNAAMHAHPHVDFARRGSFPVGGIAENWLAALQDPLFLPGTSGFRVAPHDYTVRNSSGFGVALTLRSVAGEHGYLFAKATAAGSRFYSLLATQGGLRFYYRVTSSPFVQRRDFAFNVVDGQYYRVLLSVNGSQAAVYVDDVRIGGMCRAPSGISGCDVPGLVAWCLIPV